MRLSFEVIYDNGKYTVINEKGCELVHSGSSYLRIKQGDNILGNIDCPHEELAPNIKSLRFMISENMVNKGDNG